MYTCIMMVFESQELKASVIECFTNKIEKSHNNDIYNNKS